MTPSAPPSSAVATALVDALVEAGVREVVLCPGSRSSAVAYAVWSAEQAGRLRLHVRVDERSAGFLALGLAKVSRRPAVVVTTSGTAVANLHPAVLEAHHALVPLIVLSADRPAELRGTGANQTTIQPGMFADVCRAEADLAPDDSLAEVVARVSEAAAAARGATVTECAQASGGDRRPGPVHLNVQFREPLVPEELPVPGLRGGSLPESSSGDALRQLPGDGGAEKAAEELRLPKRTLVVVGDLPTLDDHRRVLAWAEAQRLPVIAEPFGTHPRNSAVPHGVLVLGAPDFLDQHLPDAIVVAGRPTLSRPVAQLLRQPGPRLLILDSGLEFDLPGQHVERLALADLTSLTTPSVPDSQWRDSWLSAGGRVEAAINASPPAAGTGAALARTLTHHLPDGALVFLGSSNTPRDLELAATFTQHVDVVASRGLAGIDGCVSTAIGLALAAPDQPTYAVLGDLTFLHDSGGLLIGPDEPRPNLTILVANDDGGGIFSTLEPGSSALATPFERLFGTPTRTDLGQLCRAHGIPHELAETPDEVAAALARRPDGIRVVEVPIDRTTHRAERERLRALAAAALSDQA